MLRIATATCASRLNRLWDDDDRFNYGAVTDRPAHVLMPNHSS